MSAFLPCCCVAATFPGFPVPKAAEYPDGHMCPSSRRRYEALPPSPRKEPAPSSLFPVIKRGHRASQNAESRFLCQRLHPQHGLLKPVLLRGFCAVSSGRSSRQRIIIKNCLLFHTTVYARFRRDMHRGCLLFFPFLLTSPAPVLPALQSSPPY